MVEFQRTIRGLALAPGFTAAALTALTMGVAVNIAIFSVVNVALLEALPFRSPASLASVWKTRPGDRAGRGLFTRSELQLLQQSRQVFRSIEGFEPLSVQLTLGAEPEVVAGARITSGLIETLGAGMFLGRGIRSEEEHAAVISYTFWRTRLGSDPAILGNTVAVDIGGVYAATHAAVEKLTIVGVLRPGMRLPSGPRTDVWISAARTPDSPATQTATLFLVARLPDGLRAEAAHGLINGAPGVVDWHVSLVPIAETLRGTARPMLLL